MHYDIKENHLRVLLKSHHAVHRDEANFLHAARLESSKICIQNVFALVLLYQNFKISSCKYFNRFWSRF